MKKRNLWTIVISALVLACAALWAGCSQGVTLTFETNGGTPAAALTAQAGEGVTLPQTVKEGFAFDGWYTSSDFSGERFEGAVSAPEKNTKYYAKWVTGYEVTLDPAGGMLDVTSLWLKEGASVYDAVKEIAPQKSGLTFGAWFMGESELARSFRMPAERVALTAKYKVDYIMQVYLQNVGRTSYQRNDELEATGQGYVHTSVTPDAPRVDGFTLQPAPKDRTPVSTLTLSEDVGQNLYSFYYDRNEYPVMYDGNPPAGVSVGGQTPYQTVIYGGMAEAAENGFSAEGYRFAGWGTEPSGDVVYLPAQQFRVTAATTLYAVWDRGYTDRFGGSDLIFFPRTRSGVAILYRNGAEFEGTREGNSFTFTIADGTTFGGSVFGASFSYEQQNVKGTYYLYDNYPRPAEDGGEEGDRYDKTCTLTVDEYLNAVYTADGKQVTGALQFSSDRGDYLFTGGGLSFHTVFQKAEDPGNNIFSVGGEEFGYYVDSNGEVILLDGYGTAFLQITLTSGYTYTLQGNYYKEGFERLWDRYNAHKIVCWLNDTSGVLTGTAGWQQYFLIAVPGYWPDMGDEYGMYFFADTSRGVYENGSETLVLDGHGQFSDSLVYTDADGVVTKGPYSIQSDYVSGSIASLMGEDAEGKEIVLKQFRLSSDGTFRVYNGPEVAYTEYYLLEGSVMQPVLLAMFEEAAEGVENSKRVEFYANNSRGVACHAGSGYVTYAFASKDSDLTVYTFTRTSAEYGFSSVVPEQMTFITTEVETNNEVRYNAYCVLERNGEALYERIKLPDGGLVWANPNIEIEGDGSIYYVDGTADGTAYRCSFFTYRDEYFDDYFGEIAYVDKNENKTSILYLLTASGDGESDYTAAPADGLPAEFYYFDPALSPEYGAFLNLVLSPGMRALYDEDFDGVWETTGSYREKVGETTLFGTQVYEFVAGGQARFTFVLGHLYFLGNDFTAYFRDVGKAGTYTSADGGTLLLDGYGTARYSAGNVILSGSYYFMTENILRLTIPADADSEARTQYEFELSGDEFSALDDCYGTWDLVDGNFQPLNTYSKIFFDGKGTYTITTNYGQGTHTQGRYELSDPAYGEYILYQAVIDGRKSNYYVRFMEYVEYANYNCVVRDRASGLYVDEHANVLSLNGFGSGTLAGNGFSSAGNFYLIDAELGFGYFLFTTSNTAYEDEIIHVLLDYEEGVFEILRFGNALYFASDLDHIAFRDDGSAFLGNLQNGDYLVTEKGVNVYIYDQYSYVYRKQELPAFGGDTYLYNGKTYYRYDGSSFTAEGEIKLLGESGEESVHASLSFEARLRGIVGFETTFTIGGTVYKGFSLSTYTEGKIDPRVEYNSIVYNIDFARSGSGWTFTVTDAGVRQFTRDDASVSYYDGAAQSGTVYHQGGRITFTYNGFGSYERAETLYDGRFLYFYDEKLPDKGVIEFHGVKESEIRTVGYHNLGSGYGGYHELKEILFTYGGKQYAIDFFEYTSGSVVYSYTYMLYGLYEYEEVSAGSYTLGVKYLQITTLAGSPGYGNAGMLQKPVAVTVLGGDKKPVVALALGPRYEGKGVWLVENDNGRAGAAYLVDFVYGEGENADRVVSGSVQKGSVQTVGLAASYNFYIFVDEKGEIAGIMAAWYGTTQFADVWDIRHEGNVWTFKGREDTSEPQRSYKLTFTKGASGAYSVAVETEMIGE